MFNAKGDNLGKDLLYTDNIISEATKKCSQPHKCQAAAKYNQLLEAYKSLERDIAVLSNLLKSEVHHNQNFEPLRKSLADQEKAGTKDKEDKAANHSTDEDSKALANWGLAGQGRF